MRIILKKKPKNPVLIEGFPGFGLVGTITTEYLINELKGIEEESATDASVVQTVVYEVGKRHAFEDLKAWFKALYEILLGQEQGPRMGSFIALYGLGETVALIERALAGENLGG